MQILKLNAKDNSLIGKVISEEHHIMVMCNSELAPFTVQLGDLQSAIDKIFTFYNIPESGNSNDVTITPGTGQQFNNNIYTYTLGVYDCATFISDKSKRWAIEVKGPVKFTADSVTLSTGSSSETVADLQVAHDGNIYHITESTGVPGQNLIVDFVGVYGFNKVNIIAHYDGTATHSITIQLYNWGTTSWDDYNTMLGIEKTMVDHSFSVFLPGNYIGKDINDGRVRVRLIHTQSGNTSHDGYIDTVALYKG